MPDVPANTVIAAQAGDAEALATLVALYDRPALRVALQILGNLHDAQDAVQEAWTVVLRRLNGLQDPNRFGPWLYRVVANVALRQRQRRTRAGPTLSSEPDDARLARICDGPGSLPEAEGLIGKIDLLPAALEALSHKDRLVLSLHYYSRMPVDRISGLLGVPAGTVKSRLYHMRQTIRKEIEKMTNATGRPEHVPADFRKVVQGLRGDIHWQAAMTGDLEGWSLMRPGPAFEPVSRATLPPNWQIAGDGLVGEDPADGNGSCLMLGHLDWTDFEVSMLITPLAGGNAQVFFRMDTQGRQWYVADLMLGWQAVQVCRLDVPTCTQARMTRLSVVNYPLEHQHEYAVSIAARGQSLTTYLDGALVNQVTDGSIARGGIGLTVWQSKTLFRDIKVRQLS